MEKVTCAAVATPRLFSVSADESAPRREAVAIGRTQTSSLSNECYAAILTAFEDEGEAGRVACDLMGVPTYVDVHPRVVPVCVAKEREREGG